jgi:DNA-binding transcriptional regulator GbsR (MarR family)
MFRVILDERRRRESDPTLHLLRECVAELDRPAQKDAHTRERLAKMLELFEIMTHWYAQVRKLPNPVLSRVLKLPERVAKVLGGKG